MRRGALGPVHRHAMRCVQMVRHSVTKNSVTCERERERERALLGTIHNGGSRVAPAHGLRITMLRAASRQRVAYAHVMVF
jgi:hypothetical protein